MCLPNSDIDLIVVNPNYDEGTMINKLYKKMLFSSYFRKVIKLKHAKVPILKIQTRDMFDIDLAFNIENGQAWIDFMKK